MDLKAKIHSTSATPMGFLPSGLCFLTVSAASAQTYRTVTIQLQERILYMDIGKIINHLSSRLRSRSQAVHAKLGIGNAQGKILNFILVESALHPVYQKDIEKEFSLRPPTVTEMLKSLEARELIVRIPDEQDGRYKRIAFTEKAAAVKDALNKEIHETEELLLRGISEEELKEFIRITEKMLQNLECSERG